MKTQMSLMDKGDSLHGRQLAVMVAIGEERKFQDQKHGHPDDNPHSIGAWLLVIESELNEAKQAAIKGGDGRNNVINEIIQIAATCVACLEQHGVNPFHGRAV